MVQLDIPAAFVASLLFLDIGRKIIKKEAGEAADKYPAVYYRFLFRSVFFAGVVIAPAGIYLLAGWPGWEQIYWTERVEKLIFNGVNALIPTVFIMAIILGAYLGHRIGYYWIVNGKEKYLRPAYIGVLVIATIIVLCNYPAFLLMGTYQEYHHNREAMAKVWENPYGFSVAWKGVMVYFIATLLYVVFKIRKECKGVKE